MSAIGPVWYNVVQWESSTARLASASLPACATCEPDDRPAPHDASIAGKIGSRANTGAITSVANTVGDTRKP